ncbi:odorant receptor 13a isoform X2 [Plodia interpunctella]|nr:odorant receptor 13a-like isoform X2 [Plodia interpunctella]
MQHQHIIRLSEELEDIFNLPNLFNVLVGSVEICALGFNLTMGSLTQIPGCVLFLSSVLLQILMMSVFGENLIRESQNIGDAAFSCEWYKFDAKTRKFILIIITRAHKPQKLTAYKFSTISYGSFSKIISTSWSYFTILKTVYKPSESNAI